MPIRKVMVGFLVCLFGFGCVISFGVVFGFCFVCLFSQQFSSGKGMTWVLILCMEFISGSIQLKIHKYLYLS